ncbi:MAG: hypothetical protein NC200_07335 [Candidatus Gastranaerophilales bacterium]|nr:hypothetical protein [Candidatus Gastranaerophilales bacterium]
MITPLNKIERHFNQKTKSDTEIKDVLLKINQYDKNNSNLNLFEKLKLAYDDKFVFTKEDKHILTILNKAKEKIENFGRIRCNNIFENKYLEALIRMKVHHIGNCYETSKISELILKMNGIKNAQTVLLKGEKENVTRDHAICIFNRDGSPFSSITRDTIVVDAWAGKSDFANNMIKYYQNECNHLFKLPKNQKIEFFAIPNESYISDEDILIFQKIYPEFMFMNPQRKFMKNSL